MHSSNWQFWPRMQDLDNVLEVTRVIRKALTKITETLETDRTQNKF